MRRYFHIALRAALFLLLLSTVLMWVRSRFRSEAFCLAKMGPNNAYVKWWIQLDTRRGRCLLQVGRAWPFTVPANFSVAAVPPEPPIQIPSFKKNQGARPTDEVKQAAPFFVDAVFPEHQTGHWYTPGDPPIEWLTKSGSFGFDRSHDQNQALVEVYFPHCFVLSLLIAILAFIELKRRKTSTSSAPQCSRCGYDLRATPQRCPECSAVPSR